MQLIKHAGSLHRTMQQWRRDLHAHPETAYQEHRTSAKVAEILTDLGLEVHCGLAKTAVVGVLTGRQQSEQAIALRADMDALPLQETNTFAHCSTNKGKMHACGHDGHTAMLLGAAHALASTCSFAGKIIFIFQPAEEGEAGAKLMCDEGLFDSFPVQAVYGMHNWPGLAAGKIAVHQDAVMAAMDSFDITITGQGCHAGMPHKGIDPIVIAAQIVTALQGIVSRTIDPLDSAVLSITKIHAGDAYNVIPGQVSLAGTCRSFTPAVQQQLQTSLQQTANAICQAYGATAEIDYRGIAPPTINDPKHAASCAKAATKLLGQENVLLDLPPSMGAEDFAFMLQRRPGAYIWLGNDAEVPGASLHHPRYDFNDDILPIGANYWLTLVEQQLA